MVWLVDIVVVIILLLFHIFQYSFLIDDVVHRQFKKLDP